MEKKKIFKILSLISFILGIFLLTNSKTVITGAIIREINIPSDFSSIFGLVLLFVSLFLFLSVKSLEEKLKVRNIAKLERHGGKDYLIDKMGHRYSLNEIEELVSEGQYYQEELKRTFWSDLLKLYSTSSEGEKWRYERFIRTLSPNLDEEHLKRKLKSYEENFHKSERRLNYRNPERIGLAKESDFTNEIYVRFENEKQNVVWPEKGKIGFVPFEEKKVIKKRGPLYSIIPYKQLISDRYLTKDGELNSEWGPQERQDYLRDNYGIDVGPRQRKMIIFKIEKDASLEPYERYFNIRIMDKVPLVKVIKKK